METLQAEVGNPQEVERGQAILLEHQPQEAKKLAISLSWTVQHDGESEDPHDADIDMDLVALLYNTLGQHRGTVSHKSTPSDDGAIVHGGDVEAMDSDDLYGEFIYIDLTLLDPDITTIYISATTLEEGLARKLKLATMRVFDLSEDGRPNGQPGDDLDQYHVATFKSTAKRADEKTHGICMGRMIKTDGFWCFNAMASMHKASIPSKMARELTAQAKAGESRGASMWKSSAKSIIQMKMAAAGVGGGSGGSKPAEPAAEAPTKKKAGSKDVVAAVEENDRMWEAKMAEQAQRIEALERTLARLTNDHGDKRQHIEAALQHIESHKDSLTTEHQASLMGLEDRILDLVLDKMDAYKREMNERAALLVAANTAPALGGSYGGGTSILATPASMNASFSRARSASPPAYHQRTGQRATNTTFDSVYSLRRERGIGADVRPGPGRRRRHNANYVCHVRDDKLCVDYHPFEASTSGGLVNTGRPPWRGTF